MPQSLRTARVILWIMAAVAILCIGSAYFLVARNAVPTAEGSAGISTIPAAQLPNATIADLPALFPAPPIRLTDQSGRPFDSASLAGHVWVLEFVFTRCPGACPILMDRMADLDKHLTDPTLRFLTITVDPDFDTPAVLSAKASSLNADARWSWLTGPHADIVTIQKKMLIATDVTQPSMHSTKLYLFDATGQCRGRYDYTPDEVALLSQQAQKLAATSKPAGS